MINENINDIRVGNNEVENEYLKSLTVKEFKAYLIAKNHLGSSFGLDKSIGFIHWKSSR